MKIDGTAIVDAPRERVYAMMLDPEVLKRTMPGCEDMTPDGAGGFRVKVTAGVGGLRGSVVCHLQVQEARAPEHYRVAMNGKGMGSRFEGWADIDLTESGAQTEVAYSGEANVSGMVAAVGNRMMEAGVRKALGNFFARLTA